MIALIRNHGQAEVKIEKNERLLQMVLMKKLDVEIVEVEELSAVGVERTGGFGSTGIICHHKVLGLTSNLNKAVVTASVACGWVGAVMWGVGAVGGAIYTRASVTCDWAGAVMRKPLAE